MNLKKFSVTITFLLLALGGYLFMLGYDSGLEKDLKSQYLRAGNFSLNSGERSIQLSDFAGKPVVLYFGYTHCPDVCPVGLAVIRDVLNEDDSLADVNVLFVTLDPERDSAEVMREYAAFFHPNILGLTGTVDEIKAVSALYGTYFRRSNLDDQSDYTVDHSAYYYLIDRDGQLVRVLDHDASVSQISEYLQKLL